MKILIIGDQHFKFELSYSSAIKDGRKSEWDEVKKTIHDKAKTCDAIVLLGDNLNTKHNHSSVIKEFVDFLNGFGDKEVHILVGNHERYGSSTALDFLQKIQHKNWKVYTEPTQTKVAGQEAMMIPFMTPALMGVETKEEGLKAITDMFPKSAWPLCFMHHSVEGVKMHGMLLELGNEIVFPQKVLEQHFSHIFAGHIHGKQNIFPSIYMTGNIFTNEMGEHDKSVWTYESDGTMDVVVKEVELPVRGIYKMVWEERNSKKDIPPPLTSIIKCYVTSRETDLNLVRQTLSFFDASIIIEQYPSERSKVHFEEGGLDLSVDSLLKLYAEAKGLAYLDIKEGFELIK